MLEKACWLVEKLMVHPETMAANLDKSYGLLYSQRVLLALIKAGMLRDDAYALVQRNALKAWEEKTQFISLLKADGDVTKWLKTSELRACFDPTHNLRHMNVIMRRVADIKW
jgi:adenylosuccinate lyase